MTFMSRTVCGLIVFGSLLLSFTGVLAEGLDRLLAQIEPSDNSVCLAEEQQKSDQLMRQFEAVAERIRIRDKLASQLIAEDLTLFQAAARFRALIDTPEVREQMRCLYPDVSESEQMCRKVIKWAVLKARIELSPGQADVLRQRLEAELQDHLQKYGTIELPD